jgi:putative SOS response-associated peptidase YedK
MSPYHDRQPLILDWRDAAAWMTGDDPATLLRPVRDDALRQWIVSTRVSALAMEAVSPGCAGGAFLRLGISDIRY